MNKKLLLPAALPVLPPPAIVVVTQTGELLCAAGETITREMSEEIERAGVTAVHLAMTKEDTEGEKKVVEVKVISNAWWMPPPCLVLMSAPRLVSPTR